MEFSFKSLPPKLFLNINSIPTKQLGVLWLPPVEQHPVTQKLDWLSGLQISNLQFSKSSTWSDDLRSDITKYDLPLDEQPPFNHSNTLLFSLPKGFKASLGLILSDSNWQNREEVFNKYSSAYSTFQTDFFIQSLDFWTSPEINNVEWIKV